MNQVPASDSNDTSVQDSSTPLPANPEPHEPTDASSEAATPSVTPTDSASAPHNAGIPISDPAAEKKLRKTARATLKDARKLFKRARKQLSEPRQKEVLDAISALENALKNEKYTCAPAHDNLTSVVSARLKFARKSATFEIIQSLLIALAVALFLRTFLIEPFKIPTRSMVPTLLEGDQLFVTKLSYGLRLPFLNDYVVRFADPERGDVIVFAFPREDAARYLARTNSNCLAAESLTEDKDYIKRIIGIPGDTIEVINQVIYVNGEPLMQVPFYERTVTDFLYLADTRHEAWNRETQGNHSYMTITHDVSTAHFGPIKVLPDHVFVMGDNRDNSADSRCWGQVPIKNIKGRAQIIWWSSGHQSPRWERMFTSIE